MNIGIIGIGNIGSGLAKQWGAKNHQVMVASRQVAKAKELAPSLGKNVQAGTVADAVKFGDVITLAVPWGSVPDALQAAGSLSGKTVIDATNPLVEGEIALAIGHTTSAAEEIAKLAPGAKVVKCFNTIFAGVMQSSPQFGSERATAFYCGDDADAKKIVAGLAEDIGFDAVDAGPLWVARELEPLAVLLVQLGYGMGMGTNVAFKLLRR